LQQKLQTNDFAHAEREELARIDAQLKQLGYDAGEHEARRGSEAELRSSQQQLLELEKAKSALQPLEREIEETRQSIQTAEETLGKLEEEHQLAVDRLKRDAADLPDLDALEKEYYAIQEKANQLLRDVGYARNQVDVLDRQREQLKIRKGEREEINLKIASLRTLEKAFGKDGFLPC